MDRPVTFPANRHAMSHAPAILLDKHSTSRGNSTVGLLDRFRTTQHSGLAPAPAPVQTLIPAQPQPGWTPGPGPAGWAVIDVETTGLSARQDRVVELAIVRTDTNLTVIDEWVCRFYPDGPAGATHIHGITDADVAHAPRFPDVLGQVTERLAGAAIVGHNVNFDLAFLRAEYARAGWALPYLPALCTYGAASSTHLPHLARHRLGDCCAALGIPLADAHSALGDARATHALLCGFLHPHWGIPPTADDLGLPAHAHQVVWPTAPGGVTFIPGERQPSKLDGLPEYVQRKIAREATRPAAPALRALLDDVRLADALDEGAPDGSLAYLELLAEAIEDGVLTDAEQQALSDLAALYELDEAAVAAAHRGFVLALAYLALDDGKVTRAEKDELATVSALLRVDAKVLDAQLKHAEAAREARLSAGLGPLPDGWAHGEPLRVGDKVVFTGCDEAERAQLEARAEQLGVRVMSSVNGRTAMLVTDGSFSGGKAADAASLGTRLVTPAVFAVLLQHLQPAPPRAERAPVTRPAAGGAAASSSAAPTGLDPASVRAWARSQGMTVGERGRLHSSVLLAYQEAHPELALPSAL